MRRERLWKLWKDAVTLAALAAPWIAGSAANRAGLEDCGDAAGSSVPRSWIGLPPGRRDFSRRRLRVAI